MQQHLQSLGYKLGAYEGFSRTQHIHAKPNRTEAGNKHAIAFLVAAFPYFNFSLVWQG